MNTPDLYKIYLSNPSVIIDSRLAGKGKIFFGLKGTQENGGKYAAQALEKGCAAAVVDDSQYAHSPGCILVNNSLETLQALANFHRKQLSIPIIGITGSNGKTTTKELIHAVLSQRYKTIATLGNLNNQIGVPLTILSIPAHAEIAIIEMGANHLGEIHALCQIAEPTHGIITTIGKAHLEGFGSFEGVIQAKTELYRYLNQTGGTVFAHADNPILTAQLKDFRGKTILYGLEKENYCSGKIENSQEELSVSFSGNSSEHKNNGLTVVPTHLVGSYNLPNLLAAACIGMYMGIPEDMIAQALSSYTPQNNRSQLFNSGRNQLILDYYNANPSSMEAALRNFESYTAKKKAVVLGDMLELGEYSQEEHEKILSSLSFLEKENVYLVGPEFTKAAEGKNFRCFPDSVQLSSYLSGSSTFHDYTILIKGSRGIRLEAIVALL